MRYWSVMVVGVLGGLAVGVQAQIAGLMAQRIGGFGSSFIIHLSGTLFAGIFLWSNGGQKLQEWHTLPWYMLGSGAFGLILHLSIAVTQPRLGATMMITLIIFGQLMAGLLIDHFGWLGSPTRTIDTTRVVGVVALLAGSYLISR